MIHDSHALLCFSAALAVPRTMGMHGNLFSLQGKIALSWSELLRHAYLVGAGEPLPHLGSDSFPYNKSANSANT